MKRDSRRLHPLLQQDLEIVKSLRRYRRQSLWINRLVKATTSPYRTRSISLVLWIAFGALMMDGGFAYVWACIGNLVVTILLQYLVQAERPVDASRRLLDKNLVDPDTYGFPCIDCHMTVVVLSILYDDHDHFLLQAVALVFLVYIGLNKLMIAERFVYQVLGSWLTGVLGVLVAQYIESIVRRAKVSAAYNTEALLLTIFICMGVLGIYMENNQSRVIGVPREDFTRVLDNIMSSKPPSDAKLVQSRDSEASDPTSKKERLNTESDTIDETAPKDSFYYLMRTMQRRRQRLIN